MAPKKNAKQAQGKKRASKTPSLRSTRVMKPKTTPGSKGKAKAAASPVPTTAANRSPRTTKPMTKAAAASAAMPNLSPGPKSKGATAISPAKLKGVTRTTPKTMATSNAPTPEPWSAAQETAAAKKKAAEDAVAETPKKPVGGPPRTAIPKPSGASAKSPTPRSPHGKTPAEDGIAVLDEASINKLVGAELDQLVDEWWNDVYTKLSEKVKGYEPRLKAEYKKRVVLSLQKDISGRPIGDQKAVQKAARRSPSGPFSGAGTKRPREDGDGDKVGSSKKSKKDDNDNNRLKKTPRAPLAEAPPGTVCAMCGEGKYAPIDPETGRMHGGTRGPLIQCQVCKIWLHTRKICGNHPHPSRKYTCVDCKTQQELDQNPERVHWRRQPAVRYPPAPSD